jgi:capsid protein
MSFFDLFRPPRLQTYRYQRAVPTVAVSDLEPFQYSLDTGSKFPGGFGPTNVVIPDYWTLRARSWQLFETNHYARGLIARLVTNEINVGLHLEATPEEAILGFEKDELAEWSETAENRFRLWAGNASICDEAERLTFGELQAVARLEALVAGDVLVVLRQDQRTKLPRVQLVPGERVQGPLTRPRLAPGHTIEYGVELDAQRRHVAYWVRHDDQTVKRLPAFGEKSGRRLAWLLYGTEKRHRDVRGKPLLALMLQALKEIDRYRDAALRKAVINSILALFIEKGEAKMGTRPITAGAVRRGTATESAVDPNQKRQWSFAEHLPGLILEELQQGEKPVPFSHHGTDVNFGEFESAMLASIAWSRGMPPEILTLQFQSNYSASKAASGEFEVYLHLSRTDFGIQFCQPLYVEWLLAETLAGKVEASSLLDAFRDFTQYDTFGAWVSADWTGQIKPAIDLLKLANGQRVLIAEGLTTRARAAREITGMKFSKIVAQLKRENEQLAEANAPIAALSAPPVPVEAREIDDEGNLDDEDEREETRDDKKKERLAS